MFCNNKRRLSWATSSTASDSSRRLSIAKPQFIKIMPNSILWFFFSFSEAKNNSDISFLRFWVCWHDNGRVAVSSCCRFWYCDGARVCVCVVSLTVYTWGESPWLNIRTGESGRSSSVACTHTHARANEGRNLLIQERENDDRDVVGRCR